MQPSDLKPVAAVERAAYDTTLGVSASSAIACLPVTTLGARRGRLRDGLRDHVDRRCGSALAELCVHPSSQHLGYGRRLLSALFAKAQDAEVDQISLEVRPSNQRALKLYTSVGFEQIGLRPAYYQAEHGREDAVILAATVRSLR